MKIGIMTFWWDDDNYGQILQCYALQKYLRDAGHDAYLIRYDPRNDYIKTPIWKKILKAFNPVKLYMFLLCQKQKRVRKSADVQEKYDNPRYFDVFMDKHIKQSEKIYYSYKELVENPPSADMYIVGSDQVWNISIFGGLVDKAANIIKAYLLYFGDTSIKRISYAASFGKEKEELNADFINIFMPLIKKFDYVSVREKSGVDICRQCGIDNAEWVPDPTLLMDVDIYRSLYREESIRKPDKPYCFLYLVSNTFDFSIQTIYDWVQRKNIGIVYVTANSRKDDYEKTYATIPEWIYLLEHAEYVISNSYHCTIFSLFFGKRFGVIPLWGNNTRFDSIFQLFGVEGRYMDLDFSVMDKDIDWQSVFDKFQSIRNACKLSEIVSGEMKCP